MHAPQYENIEVVTFEGELNVCSWGCLHDAGRKLRHAM